MNTLPLQDLNKTQSVITNIQNIQDKTENYMACKETVKFQLAWEKTINRHQCRDETDI